MLFVNQEESGEKYAEWVEVDTERLALEGSNLKESAARRSNSSEESPMQRRSDDEGDDLMHN